MSPHPSTVKTQASLVEIFDFLSPPKPAFGGRHKDVPTASIAYSGFAVSPPSAAYTIRFPDRILNLSELLYHFFQLSMRTHPCLTAAATL